MSENTENVVLSTTYRHPVGDFKVFNTFQFIFIFYDFGVR